MAGIGHNGVDVLLGKGFALPGLFLIPCSLLRILWFFRFSSAKYCIGSFKMLFILFILSPILSFWLTSPGLFFLPAAR